MSARSNRAPRDRGVRGRHCTRWGFTAGPVVHIAIGVALVCSADLLRAPVAAQAVSSQAVSHGPAAAVGSAVHRVRPRRHAGNGADHDRRGHRARGRCGAGDAPRDLDTPSDSSALASWQARYAQARAALLAHQYEQAAAALSALEHSAPSLQDRVRAAELASIAREEWKQSGTGDQPYLRTSDELTVLYTFALMYGLGTSAWLALQLRPESFGTALLPFVIATPASVALVALADNYRPLRHGIPHAIAAGLYLGLGEGIWLAGYQNAYAAHHDGQRWSAERVSTALWVASTVGAVAGGVIGAWRRPTPGRVSFTSSAAIWGGLISAFATSALVSDPDARSQNAFVVGSMGYNAGLVAGLLFGPSLAPSVTRVRLTDLGGLFGGLAASGGYALLARHVDSRIALGSAAIGSALGLGLTWWATSGMPADHSHDTLPPAIGAGESRAVSALRPLLAPVRGGMLAGITGALR